MQLIINEEVEKETDQRYVESIRGLKDRTGWSTQQAMDVLRIPHTDQIRYAEMV